MVRTLNKALILALCLLAVGAIGAPAAFAGAFNSESSTGNTILEASQEATLEYKDKSGIAKCTTAVANGTQTGNSVETLTAHPEFSGCKLAGIPASVTTTGCNWQFSKTGSITGGITANAAITCLTGDNILFTSSGCTDTISAQTGLTDVEIHNTVVGGFGIMRITFLLTNITHTETGASCASSGVHTDGVLTGTLSMHGFADNAGIKGPQVKIWAL